MDHVDAGRLQGKRGGRPVQHADPRQSTGTPPRERREARVGLDAHDGTGGAGEQRQVEAGAAADVEDVAVGPAAEADASWR